MSDNKAPIFHSLRTKTFVLFGVLLTIVLGVFLMYFQAEQIKESHHHWVEHTHQVLQESEALLGAIRDAETGQRGYLLTLNSSYLKPYLNGIRQADVLWLKLNQHIGDNPDQQLILDRIKSQMQMKFDEMGQTVELARNGDREKALEIVETDAGKELMDGLRILIDLFQSVEVNNLNKLEQQYDDTREFFNALFVLILIGLSLCTFVVLFYVQRSVIKPVLTLTEGAQRIESGQDPELISSYAKDEIGALSNALSNMYLELKRREGELSIEKSRAEEANLAKSRFLSMMSHEIRTPLNGVLGMTELVMQSDLNPDQRTMMETISSSGNHLLAVINDVLDMSKIEANELKLETTEFELVDIFSYASSVFSAVASEKLIDLEFDNEAEVSIPVKGDPTRVRQVLTNLISNAVKFTADGSVRIKLLKPVYDAERSHVRVSFSVADTGIGIPEDKIDQVFSSFSQAEDRTTREFGGSGLGLAIAKELVEKMNGDISVESEWGKGTVFRITLEFETGASHVEESERIDTAHSQAEFNGAGLSILVAEDVMVNAMVAKNFLEQLGVSLTLVDNGRKAVEIINQQAFDIVLMDIHMPEMDGVEATRSIRENSQIKQPWIVALTADAFIDHHEKYLAAGMNDILTKPFTRAQLSEKLRQSVIAMSSVASSAKISAQ